MLVATHRELTSAHPQIRPISGGIEAMVSAALAAADGLDVYIDGGNLIRQAMDAGLVDELIITLAPVLLGEGHALFAGVMKRHALEFIGHHRYGSMVQLIAHPKR